MTKEEDVFRKKTEIVSKVEELVESGWYTLEEIVAEIEDQLVHLVPE